MQMNNTKSGYRVDSKWRQLLQAGICQIANKCCKAFWCSRSQQQLVAVVIQHAGKASIMRQQILWTAS